MDDRFNRWFKRIRIVMELDRRDVVGIMRLGGIEISLSRADGWQRSQDDTTRRTLMTEPEFEAFTIGLVEWKRNYGSN